MASQQRKEWRDPRIEAFDETVGTHSARVHVYVNEEDRLLHLQVIKANASGVLETLDIPLDGAQTNKLATILAAGNYQAWLRKAT